MINKLCGSMGKVIFIKYPDIKLLFYIVI